MFTNNYTEEAEKVIKKICPKCNRAMKESMPHEKDDIEEPICYTCNIYWTIIGNHACENGDMIKEKNRRWAIYRETADPGI